MVDGNVVRAAFSEEQVERLTGVSRQQLRYWDRTDFFKPEFGEENRRVAYSRIYSFKDVASLRTLNVLRNQYNVPLQQLRKVATELTELSESGWNSVELFVLNRSVVFVEPDTEQYQEIVSKQYVIGLPLSVVISDTKRDIERMQRRDDDQLGQITRARNVRHNAWVVAGTRVKVETIKRFAEDGFSVKQILEEFPTLTEADVKAALAHKDDNLAA